MGRMDFFGGLNTGKPCPKCKNRATYYEGRSFDSHKCMSCGHRWKASKGDFAKWG